MLNFHLDPALAAGTGGSGSTSIRWPVPPGLHCTLSPCQLLRSPWTLASLVELLRAELDVAQVVIFARFNGDLEQAFGPLDLLALQFGVGDVARALVIDDEFEIAGR